MQRETIVYIIFLLITLENVLNNNQSNCVAAYQNNTVQRMREEFAEYKCLIDKHNLTRSFYKKQRDLKKEQMNLYSVIVNRLENCTKTLEDRIESQEVLIARQNDNMTKLDSQLSWQTQELAKLKETLQNGEQHLNASESQSATINATIVKQKEALSQKQNEILELKTQIATYSSLIQTNSAQLLAHKTRILSLEANGTRSTQIISELNEQINQLQLQSATHDRLISSLQATAKEHLKCCKATSCAPLGSSTDVHTIYVPDFGALQVLCNGQLAGPGWTVIQRRFNGSVDFYRDWSAYRSGFGALTGEFFIGLDQLHYMTKAAPQELYVQLEDFDGETRYAQYDDFKVGNAQQFYALTSLGKHSGTAEDTLRLNEGQKFSTHDKDNDSEPAKNCAREFHGAWWYNSCGLSNLNGRYLLADTDYEAASEGIFWDSDWHDYEYSLKSVQLMIRPRK